MTDTSDGSEQRRFARHEQLISVALLSKPGIPKGRTVNISKTGALVEVPLEFSLGEEIVLEMEWGDVNQGAVVMKGRVMRVNTRGPGRWHLGVEFKECLSRALPLMFNFLGTVLHITDPETRVLNRGAQEDQIHAFSFDEVRREGDERLAVVASKVVGSMEELDEVDQLLESFGTGAMLGSGRSTASDLEDTDAGSSSEVYVVNESTNEEVLAGDMFQQDAKGPQGQPVQAKATPAAKPKPAGPEVSAGSALLGKMKKAMEGALVNTGEKKGGDLLSVKPAHELSAVVNGLEAEFNSQGRRGKAGVVKLQEGSLRCVVADEPPEPYRSILVSIIVTGGKKPQAIALHGDVVRVVRSTDGTDMAHFDVRLSMRNSAETLAAYRSLIEKLGAQGET